MRMGRGGGGDEDGKGEGYDSSRTLNLLIMINFSEESGL